MTDLTEVLGIEGKNLTESHIKIQEQHKSKHKSLIPVVMKNKSSVPRLQMEKHLFVSSSRLAPSHVSLPRPAAAALRHARQLACGPTRRRALRCSPPCLALLAAVPLLALLGARCRTARLALLAAAPCHALLAAAHLASSRARAAGC
jgi:hypothetical protein